MASTHRPALTEPAAEHSTPKSALSFALTLVLVGGPLLWLVSVTRSTLLAGVVGGFVALAITLSFPKNSSTRLLAAGLVLAPDLVTVTSFSGSPVTARTVMFVLMAVATMLAVLRGQLELRVPTPLLLLTLTVAGVWGAVDNSRTKSLLEFFVLMIAPIVVGATLATRRDVALEFLRGLAAGTLVLCVVALVEAVANHDFLVDTHGPYAETFLRAGHVRAAAGWSYPTELSAFLCLAGFFVIEMLRDRWGLFGMVAGGLVVTAAVLSSQSRSGVLGLAAGALAYVLFQRKLTQALRVLVGLAVAGTVLMFVPGVVSDSFRNFASQSFVQGTGANANVNYRQDLYHAASLAMSHQPLFGYGYGSGKSVATNGLSTYFGNLTDLASLPVSMAIQLGYVGTAATALILLTALVRLAQRRTTIARLPLAVGIVACLVAMSGVPMSPPLFWMLLLAGMSLELSRTAPEPADDGDDGLRRRDPLHHAGTPSPAVRPVSLG